ncbi:MAG: hypothetical protein ACI9SP_004029 [Arenicella sp.]|jgi:hypothetical protein
MADQYNKKEPQTPNDGKSKGHHYTARQYRLVPNSKGGWTTRSERIGVAFLHSAKGSICFRPSGAQLIEGDVYLFPVEGITNE